MRRGQLRYQRGIQRFDETHVGDSSIELLARFQRWRHHGAESQYGDLTALTSYACFTDFNRIKIGLDHRARAGSAWVTYRRWTGVTISRA